MNNGKPLSEQLKDLYTKVQPVVMLLRKSLVLIVFLAFMLIYTILVFRVNHFVGSDPTDAEVGSKLQTIQRPKVDPQTLAKIQQLQSQNIKVKSLFVQARSNPFSE